MGSKQREGGQNLTVSLGTGHVESAHRHAPLADSARCEPKRGVGPVPADGERARASVSARAHVKYQGAGPIGALLARAGDVDPKGFHDLLCDVEVGSGLNGLGDDDFQGGRKQGRCKQKPGHEL